MLHGFVGPFSRLSCIPAVSAGRSSGTGAVGRPRDARHDPLDAGVSEGNRTLVCGATTRRLNHSATDTVSRDGRICPGDLLTPSQARFWLRYAP